MDYLIGDSWFSYLIKCCFFAYRLPFPKSQPTTGTLFGEVSNSSKGGEGERDCWQESYTQLVLRKQWTNKLHSFVSCLREEASWNSFLQLSMVGCGMTFGIICGPTPWLLSFWNFYLMAKHVKEVHKEWEFVSQEVLQLQNVVDTLRSLK